MSPRGFAKAFSSSSGRSMKVSTLPPTSKALNIKSLSGRGAISRFGCTCASRPLDFPDATIRAHRCAFGPSRPLRVSLMSGIATSAR